MRLPSILRIRKSPSSRLRGVVIAALAVSACASGKGNGERPGESPLPRFAVLSAFPAELAPLLIQATIDGMLLLEGHVFRTGVLGGVPVVLGLTGIGLVNAATTTRAVLEQFDLAGVVFSGVAGSLLSIGDVGVPETWALTDGLIYSAPGEWLELAHEIAASGAVSLERCTVVPPVFSEEPVCMPHEPAVLVGGMGQSSDPFGGKPFPCLANGGDVFGCDVTPPDTASEPRGDRSRPGTRATVDAEAPVVTDMETAAIAREAAARGVPFIAFRAVSDGADDPLGLPGFPVQFFAYYRLGAHNAAAAAVAFLGRLATVMPGPARGAAAEDPAE